MKPCTQCGRCCTNPRFMGGMEASSEDLDRWRREGRYDILQYAGILGSFADLWISPRTNNEMNRCPFVRKRRNLPIYDCTIYDTRPQICREYPLYVGHMMYVDCEMLEEGDTDEEVDRFMGRESGAEAGAIRSD
jgi:Fe-S-cluster containining protein